jgi:hypothetical protein
MLAIRGGDSAPCDNKDRYIKEDKPGAERLDEGTAASMVSQYRTEYPPENNNNHPTGFVFTKRMFDEIFVDPTINSVTLDLVNYNENISLVVKGFKTNATKIIGDGTSRIYVIQSFCPTDCSVW